MNVLVLTSEYKDYRLKNGDPFTYISNSFCREWVKQGHNVLVIHNASCFPKIIYYLPNKIKRYYEVKRGSTWGTYDSVKKDYYVDEGVQVYRMPIRKFIPHRSPTNKVLDKQAERIVSVMSDNNFAPDVIIGQWISPQMELIYRLRSKYECRTAVVLHGIDYINLKSFNTQLYLSAIDRLGTRSKSQSEEVKKLLNLNETPFVCYSGIPDEYIKNYSLELSKFENIKKWKFVFVGRLVEYKRPGALIKALSMLNISNWELNIIGDGGLRLELENLCKELNCEDKVIFHGKVSRENVIRTLSECHCFAMISKDEVFGLAYLEAMLASCITIASKGSGIDGIINNGVNGYLCPDGDVNELRNIFEGIITTSPDENKKIANKGYNTAIRFSDSEIASQYLKQIFSDN